MSDQTPEIPDNIEWWQSAIIWKQLVMAICAVASGFGLAIAPQQEDTIIAAIMAFVALAGTISTIHNRMKKPCPNVNPVGAPKLPSP